MPNQKNNNALSSKSNTSLSQSLSHSDNTSITSVNNIAIVLKQINQEKNNSTIGAVNEFYSGPTKQISKQFVIIVGVILKLVPRALLGAHQCAPRCAS